MRGCEVATNIPTEVIRRASGYLEGRDRDEDLESLRLAFAGGREGGHACKREGSALLHEDWNATG